jgi:hypothetical protein
MLINAAFLQCWRVLPPRLMRRGVPPRRTLWLTVTMSLTVWLVLAALFVAGTRHAVRRERWWIAMGSLVTLLTVGLLATIVPEAAAGESAEQQRQQREADAQRERARRNQDPVQRAVVPPAPTPPVIHELPALKRLVPRALMAGIAVGGSVLVGSVNASAAGIAAIFPAIFLTTMVTLWLAHGDAVPLGAAGPMMLGSGSVSIYAIVFAWALSPSGSMWLAALGAYIVAALLYSAPVGFALARRDQRRRQREDLSRLDGELLSVSHSALADDDEEIELEL